MLLKRKEINKLIGRINQEGLTIVPTKLYFVKGKVKVQIAVAKGKKPKTSPSKGAESSSKKQTSAKKPVSKEKKTTTKKK